jgi:metal-responsive CopG/Arc/MetJ family transcriptional regulator
MPKVRTTLTIDDEVLRAVKHSAARGGKRESEVIEEALRRELGLDLLDELWSRNEMSDKAASTLALEAQHETRPTRSRRKRR